MEKVKLQIEINNRSYDKDAVYVAISLRGGYITRNYIVDGACFESNCAFYNVLFNYYRLLDSDTGLHYDIQRGVSTVSFCKNKTEFKSVLKNVLDILFNHEYDSEKFEKAKQITREAFATRYKDGAFRSKYKGHEFSDLNKRFTLKQLINDIERISFEDFARVASVLVVPGNVCIYIAGKVGEMDFSVLSPENCKKQFSSVRIAGYEFEPYFRQDAYIINRGREEHNFIIESFDFMNEEITNFTKQLVVEVLAEQLSVHEIDVWVDSLDASIMFVAEQLRSYKRQLTSNDEKSYEVAHKSLLRKYASLIENKPEHFVIKAANMMTIGVYIDQYLEFLGRCSYELFKEICEKADYKITEAQVVLRKESR